MDTVPAPGDLVTYVNDDRTFTVLDEPQEVTAQPAVVASAADGEKFCLLVAYCTPAPR